MLVSVTKKKEEKNLSTFFHAEDRNFEKGRHDTQHNNIQHNDILHNDAQHSDTQYDDTQHDTVSIVTFCITKRKT
jgi:hypothetical protein